MARAKTSAADDCTWPEKRVETTRKILNANRNRWPEIAKRACVGERYLRAFARSQIKCPPADRFLLVETALSALGLKSP